MNREERYDRAIEEGRRVHYDDPGYYDHAYNARSEDIAFYTSFAAASGGPVLEYGVGNGRIALPLARQGIDVVGVDLSEPMLNDLRGRLAKEKASTRRCLRLRHGDMRSVTFRRRFPLILCPFNSFLHLYTRHDVQQFLGRVGRHLARGGRCVIDTSLPHPGDLSRDPNRAYRAPRFRHPTTKQVVRYAERFDYDSLRQILFVTMEFHPVDGRPGWTTLLAHRQYFPQELRALFAYNGWKVEAVYGGFAGEPLDRSSDVAVWQLVPAI